MALALFSIAAFTDNEKRFVQRSKHIKRKLKVKKRILITAITLTFSAVSAQAAVLLNFDKSTANAIQGTDFSFAQCQFDFVASTEFRMCDPTGDALGGGNPRDKESINGTESWSFEDSGVFTFIGDTATTGGISSTNIESGISSAAPNGDIAIDQGAIFFSTEFAFLAPTQGSSAGDVYGEAIYTETSYTSFEIFFPVLEAQWAGNPFPLGISDTDGDGVGDGITFFGTTDGSTFSMWAEHTITAEEDPANAGFIGWTAQWYYVGDIVNIVVDPDFVPVPAAIWLFGSGILGLAGVARRRKTR